MAFPNLGPLFYIDTWPFGPQMLVATSPDSANQMAIAHSLPKFTALREYVKPTTGGVDLTTPEGHAWKTWRKIFEPDRRALSAVELCRHPSKSNFLAATQLLPSRALACWKG